MSSRVGAAAEARAAGGRGPSSRTSLFWTLGFATTVMAATSRGLLELIVGKTPAYGLQVVALGLFVVVLIAAGAPHARPSIQTNLIVGYVFFLVAVVSAAVSLVLNDVDYSGPFVAVMLFFAFIVLANSSLTFGATRRIAVGPVLVIVTLALAAVGLAQQFAGLTIFPGTDTGTFGTTVRPSSLTGSFLHYPIALALLGLALLGIYAQTRRLIYLTSAIVGFLAVAASLSRSGLVIVVVGLLVGILFTQRIGAKIRAVGAAIAAGALVFMFLPAEQFVSRALSIFDAQGAGNSTRIDQWTDVIRLWLASPLVVGSHTGQYTNVTSNLTDTATTVTESGALQQLISFGLLGALAFYALLVGSIVACRHRPIWFRAALVAAIVQSAFYQSTEVLPFMALVALMPLIADRYVRGRAVGTELEPRAMAGRTQ